MRVHASSIITEDDIEIPMLIDYQYNELLLYSIMNWHQKLSTCWPLYTTSSAGLMTGKKPHLLSGSTLLHLRIQKEWTILSSVSQIADMQIYLCL